MRNTSRPYLVLLIIIVSIAACAASYEVGRSSRNALSAKSTFVIKKGNWTSVNIPVKTCTSSYGVASQSSGRSEKHLRLSPPSKVASSLTFYTDSKHLLAPILGPAGWNCSASLGADGGSEISIYPQGVKDPVAATNGTEITMGIEEQMIPACQGCIADLACSVFLNAEQQLGYTGQYCPGYVPTSESVRFLEGNAESSYGIALLTDPAGSPGTVALSGGDYPATGALIYQGPRISRQDSASSLGCVLSGQFKRLCDAIVNNFISTFGRDV